MARKAEVIFVGDASSLVRAAAESEAAIKGLDKSVSGSKGLNSLPQLGGNITNAMMAAAPAVEGLAGSLGALTASLGAALAGASAVAVGGLGALATGFGSIALVVKPAVTSFGNVDKALKAYNTTLANHSTTAKQAAAAQSKLNAVVSQNGGTAVLSAVKSWDALGASFKDLTGPATKTLFSTFNAGLGTLKSLLPTVAGIANQSMTSLAQALQRPLSILRGSSFKSDLTAMGDTFSKAIGPGVDAAANAFQAFSNIAKAASPYVVDLVNGLDTLASKFLAATQNSKTLKGNISSLVSQSKAWGGLLAATGKLLFNIFKQGADTGKGLVTSLTGVVNKWNDWAKSAKGTKDIASFFQQSAAFVKEFLTAFAPVVQAFSTLSTGALPIYVSLMANLKGIMGPLTDAFVGYKVALVAATVATSALKVAQTAWYVLTTVMSHAMDAYDVATLAWIATADDATIATKAWAAAQAAFDVILDASPIGAIIVGVAALAAGIVILATKTHFLQDAWKTLEGVATSAWDKIKTTTTTVFNSVKGFIKQWWPLLIGIFTGGLGTLVAEIITHWGTISSKTTAVWNSIKSFVSGVWHDIESTASNVWSGISGAITGAVSGAFSKVKGAVGDAEKWLSGAWKTISKGVTGFAGDVKSGIVNAFQSAVNTVIGFVNDIIGVLDKIPGVNIAKLSKLGGGGGKAPGLPTAGQVGAAGFATGGVVTQREFAKGGPVNRPTVVVGEEAPNHPEVVIATNPAYRERNLGLFAEAGRRLGVPGFAQGGIVTASEYSDHGPGAFGLVGDVQSEPGFAELEMGHALGDLKPGTNISVKYGGKTITIPKLDIGLGGPGLDGRTRAIDLTMPAANELHFPGLANVDWSMGGSGGGILGKIGGFFSGAGGAVSGILGSLLSKGASAITSLLPGTGSLPKWLDGTGEYVLKAVGGWIKAKVGGIVKGLFGGGGGGSGPPTVPAQGGPALKVEDRMFARAKSIIGLPYTYGGGHGSFVDSSYDCSGAVSDVLNAGGFLSSPETTVGLANFGMSGPGKYITIGVTNGDENTAHTMMSMFGQYFESGGHTTAGPHWDTGWSQSFQQYRHPVGYAKGGITGVPKAESKIISKDMSQLASLVGTTGDYARQNEKLSYFPSLWATSNPLLGAGASSFINTTDAQGNMIAPTVNTAALGLTRNQEGQELGWYSSQVSDLRKSLPLSQKVAPKIQDAIKRLKAETTAVRKAARTQVAKLKQAARQQIAALVAQIKLRLRVMAELKRKITKAENATEPYPNAKNKTQRAANAKWEATRRQNLTGWRLKYASLEAQNRQIGGDETQVGTGGQIGSVTKQYAAKEKRVQDQATAQVAKIGKQITGYQSQLSSVTGSGAYSPLTLEGITGLGGELGPALLQKASTQSLLASISDANIAAALKSAQDSYASSITPTSPTTPTATPTTPSTPVAVPTGPTTVGELSALLAGMPPLAYKMGGVIPYGGARATGGPVQAGYAYTVGENGRETFVPDRSGTILNANQTAGGRKTPTVHIEHFHAHSASEARRFADRLAYRTMIGTA